MILDSYGSEEWAKLEISHKHPSHVLKNHLEYYGRSIYSFMELRDRLFYLYPIFKFYLEDSNLEEHLDFMLYNLEREVKEIDELLSEEHKKYLSASCLTIFKKYKYHNAWDQAPLFSKFVGLNTSEKLIASWESQTYNKN